MATTVYKPRYNKSYALVIGIDRYTHEDVVPALETARLGAEAVGRLLDEQYQFDEVVSLLDTEATQSGIEDAYTALRAETGPDDRFVVYFAGHVAGVSVKGQLRVEGWLLTHDSDHTRHHRLVRMADLLDPNYMAAKHAVVILDSYHSGLAVTYEAPRATSPPSDPRRALEHFLTRRAYQVIASANPYETATDAGLLEGHTPFTGYLLRALEGVEEAARDPATGLLTAASTAEYVRSSVATHHRNWQGPQTGILPGDGGGVMVWQVQAAIDTLPDRLRRGLSSEDADTRFFAIERGEQLLTDPQLGTAIREVLDEMVVSDPDEEVRRRVLNALRSAPEPVIVPSPPEPTIDVSAPEAEPTSATAPRIDNILDILPPPFEWVEIPSGQAKLEYDAGTFDVRPFRMAKYPITYAQFQVFIDAVDGFYDDRWWAGLAANTRHRKKPGRQAWPIDSHPRENVSWYDAVVFCRWLSSRLGQEVRLPAEWEWQWAARGKDGRVYPWGNTFDATRCNAPGSGIDQTSPVDQYPDGASPFGVLDMVGNVLEWCLNEYNNPQEVGAGGRASRGLHGGSWYVNGEFARAVFRHHRNPRLRDDHSGFRVVAGAVADVSN